MLTVSGGRLADRELLKRVGRRAFSTAPGALGANEAIVTAGIHPRRPRSSATSLPRPRQRLVGGGDRLVPVTHVTRVRDAIPQAEVTVWQAMAHHPQHERPAELNTYLAATTPGPTAVNHTPCTRRPRAAASAHRDDPLGARELPPASTHPQGSDETSSSMATRRLFETARRQTKQESTATRLPATPRPRSRRIPIPSQPPRRTRPSAPST